nr:RRXRR domain-containing protein [Microseira wollei]
MSKKNAVFVLDSARNPCNPIHPAVARKLLSEHAAVFRQYPFTVI